LFDEFELELESSESESESESELEPALEPDFCALDPAAFGLEPTPALPSSAEFPLRLSLPPEGAGNPIAAASNSSSDLPPSGGPASS
jgi:hypothetical protein